MTMSLWVVLRSVNGINNGSLMKKVVQWIMFYSEITISREA